MHRFIAAALTGASLAACASGGTASSGGPDVRSERVTTVVAASDAHGNTIDMPMTTYRDVARIAVDLHGSADEAFRVLPDAYADLGIQVGTVNAGERVVGNTQVRASRRLGRAAVSTYLDCGTSGLVGPAADAYPVRISVLSTVEPTGGTSRLRTVVQGVYTMPDQGGASACTTTGALERAIATAVNLRLARG